MRVRPRRERRSKEPQENPYMNPRKPVAYFFSPPNVPPVGVLWSVVDGIWALKSSGGVLAGGSENWNPESWTLV